VFQVSSGGSIYAANADGTGIRRLTSGIDPALSPDGKQVAFTRWEDSSSGARGSLWLINSDGTGEHQLLSGVNQPKSPTWSPDGQQIVISVQQGGSAGGRECFSFRGTSFCFDAPADPYWGLRLVDAADGSSQPLPAATHSFAPAWDPVKPWHLVYAAEHGLVSLDLNRGTQWPLTIDASDRSPAISPDGRKVAVSYRQADHWEVHTMNADGSGRARLTQMPLTLLEEPVLRNETRRPWNNAAPAWSPDGKRIAFVTDRSGAWEIWVMNADGSNQRPLITAAALKGERLEYNGVDERVISWH
jgi:Tol biopolymer transport system component